MVKVNGKSVSKEQFKNYCAGLKLKSEHEKKLAERKKKRKK